MRGQKGLFLILPGLLLIAAALFLVVCNLYDGLRAGRAAGQTVNLLEAELPEESTESPAPAEEPDQEGEELPAYRLFPDMEMPVKLVDGIEYVGVLRIPVLELELPVASEWSYENLKAAPCRYGGSAYSRGLILCGHNYPTHFGRLNELRPGDVLLFTDMDGNVFTYETAELEILDGGDTEGMESGGWALTLFTCTLDGQNRVTVRCTEQAAD